MNNNINRFTTIPNTEVCALQDFVFNKTATKLTTNILESYRINKLEFEDSIPTTLDSIDYLKDRWRYKTSKLDGR